jgi:hypothetical protein
LIAGGFYFGDVTIKHQLTHTLTVIPGLLPSTLRASLRLLKSAPGGFVPSRGEVIESGLRRNDDEDFSPAAAEIPLCVLLTHHTLSNDANGIMGSNEKSAAILESLTSDIRRCLPDNQ